MDIKERKVPEIRFPGFTDDWEQRKLGEAFDFLQNNTLSRADLDVESGVAQNMHYGDVLIKFGEYLDISEERLPYIQSKELVDKYKSSFLKDGDIIMADTAEDETVGKCTEIAGIQGVPVISGLHTIPLRPKQKYSSGYLGYYMNSSSFHDQLLPLMQGIKVTSISKGAIKETVISYPSDLSEQELIGNYFIQLDTLITLHQRKLDAMKEYKKGMLQKMFPREGSNVPEIRFPGFTDAWEQRKLGDCCNIFAGGTPSTSNREYWDGGEINWLPSGNIQDCYIFESDISTKITKQGLDNSSAKMIKKNTALLAMTGATCGKSGYLTCESSANQSVMAFETDLLDSKFLFYTFQNNKDNILKYQAGGAQAGINKDSCQNLIFPFPSIDEQHKISKLLFSIDHLITLHQRKLEAMKECKKGLLQKMFV